MKNNALRRQRERQELRLRMLDAARELFQVGGEEAVTLRRVAEKIEYSATTIYLHFASKELLIRELCGVDFGLFSRGLKQAERVPDPIARLRKVALTYVDFGLQYPRHYRAMFMTSRRDPTTTDPATARGSQASDAETIAVDGQPGGEPRTGQTEPYDFLYSAVFKAMAAGSFRVEYRDVPLMAQVIWSGLHGVISLHLVRADLPVANWRSTQTTAEMMIDTLLSGFTGRMPVDE